MEQFHLEVGEFEWINGAQDDPEDRCLHGLATAVIAGRRISDYCTVSAAALYLLKTLTLDHQMGKENQMFPCCGFFLAADKEEQNVDIIGCDNGPDWSVFHQGDSVRLVLEDGLEEVVPLDRYREEVFRFADKVEAFYRACSPKKEPEDEFDRAGWRAFRREWRRRRQEG